jgi:hypothetical protein
MFWQYRPSEAKKNQRWRKLKKLLDVSFSPRSAFYIFPYDLLLIFSLIFAMNFMGFLPTDSKYKSQETI